MTIITKLVNIKFIDTFRVVHVYIGSHKFSRVLRSHWFDMEMNQFIDCHFWYIKLDFKCFEIISQISERLLWFFTNLRASAWFNFEQRSKFSDAPSVWDFLERLWNLWYQKNPSKNLQYADAPVSQTCTFSMDPGSGCATPTSQLFLFAVKRVYCRN